MLEWLTKILKGVYGRSPESQVEPPRSLFAIKGPLVGQVFPLSKSRLYIGRQQGYDLRMPDQDRTVSRRHAFITFKRGHFTITDTSRNGTYVNGQKISKHVLNENDQIRVGQNLIVFRSRPPSQMISAQKVSKAELDVKDKPFEILDTIGVGAMATVYRGIIEPDHLPVAIKIPHPKLCRDETFMHRFLQEGELGIRLIHPHIVRVYKYGMLDSHPEPLPYILMEYVDGNSLRNRVDNHSGPLSSGETARVGIELCDALEYAHKQEVIHRDIKPENVAFTSSNVTKIMDFGIAKQLDRSEDLTRAGQILGTPYYIAPERIEPERFRSSSTKKKHGDPRSDLYALGVMLYEMVTQTVPFVGQPFQVMEKHVHEPPKPPDRINRNIDPNLVRVILRALEKAPDERYQSAAEMKADLERVGQIGQPRLEVISAGSQTSHTVLIGNWPHAVIGISDGHIQVGQERIDNACCIIYRIEGNYAIAGLHSEIGTFLNGARLERQWLRPNDEITVGDVTLVFKV